MTEAEDFIYQFEGDQRNVMLYFHSLLTENFTLTSKIRYRIPFYYGKSWICYLNPTNNGNVEFAFTRGNELSNHQGLLENRGRKQVYSIIVEHVSDIQIQQLNEIIHEAIVLDETKPYASKRKTTL